MTMDRERVTLPGWLSGMGYRGLTCTVSAVKNPLGRDAVYSQIIISDEPKRLPDGLYQLVFAGKSFPIQRLHGAWISKG